MKEFKVDNVIFLTEKKVSSNGKVWGLTKWAGKKAIIIIQSEDNK